MRRDETVLNVHLSSIAWICLSAFLWLLFPAHAQHPRILFSKTDIPDIRDKARGTHAAIMRPILSRADALLDDPVPVYPNAPSSLTSRWGGDLSVLAFAHVATGDSRYGEKAREYLLEFATWPAWGFDREVGDRDLGLAYLIRGNALAYDWLFDSLSTQDRTTIRTSLAQHAQEMYKAASLENRSEWRNWWIKSYGQNHWDINNTSLGMAALALEGEDQRSGQWLAHVIAQMRKDSSNLDNIIDGSWHEGCLYQQSKLVYTMAFYYSLKRLKDIDLFPRRYIRNYALFALYNYLPDNRQVALTYSSYLRNWGGWLSAGGYSLLNLAASEAGSRYGRWLSQRLESEHGRSSYQAARHIAEFFYYDPSVEASAPESLPLSRTLRDLEGVIWRTGWGENDLVFGLKTGAYGGRHLYEQYLGKQYPFDSEGSTLNVGHNHADANTFWLYRGGAMLAAELGGRSTYYGPTPAYHSRSHNTVLVDGEGQYWSQNHSGVYAETDGRLVHVFGTPGFDFVASDASRRYRAVQDDGKPGKRMIDEFRRHVLFVRPSLFIMIDRLADDTPHRYEWLCYFSDSAAASCEGGWIRSACEGTKVLGLRLLGPVNVDVTIVDSLRPGVVLRPPQDVARTHFVTALVPTTDAGWATLPEVLMTAHSDTATGIRISDGNVHDYIIKYNSGSPIGRAGAYVLTGAVGGTVKDKSGTVQRLVLLGGTELALSDGTVLLSAPGRVSAEVRLSGDSTAVFGDSLSGLRIRAPDSKADHVMVNGAPVPVQREGPYMLLPDYQRALPCRYRKPAGIEVDVARRAGQVMLRMKFVPASNGFVAIQAYTIQGRLVAQESVEGTAGKTVRHAMDLPGIGASILAVSIDGADEQYGIKIVIP